MGAWAGQIGADAGNQMMARSEGKGGAGETALLGSRRDLASAVPQVKNSAAVAYAGQVSKPPAPAAADRSGGCAGAGSDCSSRNFFIRYKSPL